MASVTILDDNYLNKMS